MMPLIQDVATLLAVGFMVPGIVAVAYFAIIRPVLNRQRHE